MLYHKPRCGGPVISNKWSTWPAMLLDYCADPLLDGGVPLLHYTAQRVQGGRVDTTRLNKLHQATSDLLIPVGERQELLAKLLIDPFILL
jgi:hypothetical protein